MLSKKLYEKEVFEDFCRSISKNMLGKRLTETTDYDKYRILAMSQRAILTEKWLDTKTKYERENKKKVYYFSLEFLMGRFMRNTIDNLDMEKIAGDALKRVSLKLEDLYEEEQDAGLGNGGLGRLAACFLDSMATMDIPGYGFGIRYEYGMFNQKIENGWQVEKPDNWLFKINPWEFQRIEDTVKVKFYGNTKAVIDERGKYKVEWVNTEDVLAVPYILLIPGYKTETVNSLTLWTAKSSDDFNLDYFNNGDYEKAVQSKAFDETISKVLYPNDSTSSGRTLRLKQQYFFVSASLQAIIKDYLKKNKTFDNFPNKVAIQLNDTHPTVAIPELMRLLIDEHDLGWDNAWEIVTKTFAYTNHTLMPEALEKWKVSKFGNLLPRLLEIVYEINARFLKEVEIAFPGNDLKKRAMSIIEEGNEKKIRMAYLAIVGSHSINGVAKLHTELLKTKLLPDFYEFWPEKFNNKTNGVTQRRWLKQANPLLSSLITDAIGSMWVKNLFELKALEKHAKYKNFCLSWQNIKIGNKILFSIYLRKKFGIVVDPSTRFDFQVKRIHEYKRQLLNVLGVINQYFKIKDSKKKDFPARTVFIGGKAAPGYEKAKLIIKLINDVSAIINNDPSTNEYLKMFFLPDYNVSLAERIFPASDLSEQISTAGHEASGTGNMKFSLNGAITIGTLDGANIEIKDAVGEDNIFIFGLNAEEVTNLKANGYHPYDYYRKNVILKNVLDSIADGYFSPKHKELYKPFIDSLLKDGDQYMLLADFQSYIKCHEKVDVIYNNNLEWTKMSIMNVANMGYFSSDRTIAEYAKDIWKIK